MPAWSVAKPALSLGEVGGVTVAAGIGVGQASRTSVQDPSADPVRFVTRKTPLERSGDRPSQRQPVRRQFPGKNHEAGAICPVRKAPVALGSHFSLLTAPGASVQILVTTSDSAVARQPLLGPAGSWTPNRLIPHVTQLSYQLKNQ